MIDGEKPTLEELRHHGVMGMKWGKTKTHPTGTQIRKARRDFEGKRNDYWDAQKQVRKTTKRGSAEREAGNKKTADMRLALLKDPDRATAAKITRGEAAIYAAFALTGVGTIPIAIGVGANKVVERHIEKKQARGGYDKK
jgi:hypothetical protein